jgi:hypothetical protein
LSSLGLSPRTSPPLLRVFPWHYPIPVMGLRVFQQKNSTTTHHLAPGANCCRNTQPPVRTPPIVTRAVTAHPNTSTKPGLQGQGDREVRHMSPQTGLNFMLPMSGRPRACYNTVRTPTLCKPDTSDRPLYCFLFNLLNLATPLLSYAVRLVLLIFVPLSSLPCYLYDAILILTSDILYSLIDTFLSILRYISTHVFVVEP